MGLLAPGITNLLARQAQSALDETEIKQQWNRTLNPEQSQTLLFLNLADQENDDVCCG